MTSCFNLFERKCKWGIGFDMNLNGRIRWIKHDEIWFCEVTSLESMENSSRCMHEIFLSIEEIAINVFNVFEYIFTKCSTLIMDSILDIDISGSRYTNCIPFSCGSCEDDIPSELSTCGIKSDFEFVFYGMNRSSSLWSM